MRPTLLFYSVQQQTISAALSWIIAICRKFSMYILSIQTQDKRWNIELFIAAPQIILPESFQEKNASMILVDLGNLSFVTKSGSAKMAQDAQKNENMDVDVDGDGE